MIALMLSGCSSGGSAQGTADCSSQVRAGGIVYTSYGFTEDLSGATEHSSADVAECEDTRRDSRGAYFPESPRTVATWRFADYPPEKVLGVRFGETDTLAVYVADSVPDLERDGIYEALVGER